MAIPTQTKPGKKMPDGSVYAGLLPDTGKAMYTTPAGVSAAKDQPREARRQNA
jgi:hypothetical protein